MDGDRVFEVRIDYSRCDSCGICIFECGSKVFAWDWDQDAVGIVDEAACQECFTCEAKCPHGAVHLVMLKQAGQAAGERTA